MSSSSDRTTNLLSLKPQRNLLWETAENECVVLLVPKFRNRLVIKWFVPMLAKPNIRVTLDQLGSYCWQHFDGKTTVQEIGERMSHDFSQPVDSMYERIGKFIATLARDRFVLL